MSTAAHSLPLDVKRQVIYSALLRSAGEAQHLRNRAIDRLVLAALAESDPAHALKIGEIQQAVTIGSAQIRTEAIHDALRRLQQTDGFVDHAWSRMKRVYFLTPRGQKEVLNAASASSQLLDAVLRRTMRDLPAILPFETASEVFRTFLCECFARLGLEIAKTVTGRVERDDLLRMPQIVRAFEAACQPHVLSADAKESLRARCTEFLRSTHHDDERLKLYLTQGFFFAQLLGLDGGSRFDPLAEQAFSGAVLYLDTNTFLPRVLQADAAPLFNEMASVAGRLGIDLRITRATIDETRRVAADRERQLQTIIDKGVPDELMHRANDQFLAAFLERRENDKISVRDFFEPFEHLPDFVRNELHLTLVDLIEEDMLDGHADATAIGQVIQEESEAIRKRRKSQRTLDHDVAHFALIGDERRQHPKTWFLTHDRSVIQAAARLAAADEAPLCFSMTGFLQTISPFVTTGNAEVSLAEVFSSMLADQIATGEHMYDVEELVVLADMHEDVLATRDERLVQAIDAVRTRHLRGERFRADNAQRAALELKRFLSASASEREQAGITERERLRGRVEDGETRLESERAAAQREAHELRTHIASLETQIGALQAADTKKQTSIDTLAAALATRERQRSRNWTLVLTVAGLVLVFWDTTIAGTINANVVGLSQYWDYLVRGVRVGGLFTIAMSGTIYINRVHWPEEYRTAALIAVLAIVYALLPGIANGWNALNDPLVWIALIVSVVTARRRK